MESVDPASVQPIAFVIVFAVSAVVSVLVIGGGALLGRSDLPWVGKGGPKVLSLELFLLVFFPNVVPLLLMLSANRSVLFGYFGVASNSEIFTGMVVIGTALATPFYIALRFHALETQSVWISLRSLLYRLVLVFLTVFGAYVVAYCLVPGLINYSINLTPISESFLLHRLQRFFDLSTIVLITACLLRGLMEIVRYSRIRTYQPVVAVVSKRRFQRYYVILGIFLAYVFFLNLLSAYIYHNYHASTLPFDLYIPPVYDDQYALSSNPLNYPPFVVIGSQLCSGIMLIMALFIIMHRVPEEAALLFATLCTFYGIPIVTVFPAYGGELLWVSVILMQFLVMPLQLSFLLVFPYRDKILASSETTYWNVSLTILWLSYLFIAPSWIFLFTTSSSQLLEILQHSFFLLLFVGIGSFFGLMTPFLTWVLSVLILRYSFLGLQKAEVEAPSATACEWHSLVTNSTVSDRLVLHYQRRGYAQMRVVTMGFGLATLLYGIWFIALNFFIFDVEWSLIGIAPQSVFPVVFGVAVIVSMYYFRLWYIRPIFFRLAASTAVFTVSTAVFNSRLEGSLTPLVGSILAASLVAFLPWPTYFLNFVNWILDRNQLRSEWYTHLISQNSRLQDHDAHPLEILNAIVPPEATACWFLRPSGKESDFWTAQPIGHDHACESGCTAVLLNLLASSSVPGSLSPSFTNVLRLTTGSGTHRVIEVSKVATKAGWYSDLRNKVLTIFSPSSLYPQLPEQEIDLLEQAGIAMMIPFGNREELGGVLVIATDGQGDYFHHDEIEQLNRVVQLLNSRMMEYLQDQLTVANAQPGQERSNLLRLISSLWQAISKSVRRILLGRT